jgi:hypothetical protein
MIHTASCSACRRRNDAGGCWGPPTGSLHGETSNGAPPTKALREPPSLVELWTHAEGSRYRAHFPDGGGDGTQCCTSHREQQHHRGVANNGHRFASARKVHGGCSAGCEVKRTRTKTWDASQYAPKEHDSRFGQGPRCTCPTHACG